MQRYGNLSGHAGVTAYEIGEGSITLRFGDDPTRYLYNGDAPGPEAVRDMQRLAKEGEGLTTYVNQYVREHYARRW